MGNLSEFSQPVKVDPKTLKQVDSKDLEKGVAVKSAEQASWLAELRKIIVEFPVSFCLGNSAVFLASIFSIGSTPAVVTLSFIGGVGGMVFFASVNWEKKQ